MAYTSVPQGPEPIPIHSRKKEQDEGVPATRRNSPRMWAFLAVELIVAAVLFAAQVPLLEGALIVLLVLIALDVFADSNPIEIYGDSYISVGFIFVAAMMVIYGPSGVLIAAPIEALAPLAKDRKVTPWIAHNAAMFAIIYASGAFVYDAIAEVNPAEFALVMVPAILLGTLTSFTLNAVFIAVFGSLYQGRSLKAFWSNHTWLLPHYLAMGVMGMALALAYAALGIAGIFAFVAPAFMFGLAIQQYVAKTRDNVEKLQDQNTQLRAANIEIRRVSEELRVSYDGTLEALVNALDARDQETKGHSLRVQRYMMDIAREFGVPEGSKDWVDMARGSLLHDVGKIGVSDTILLKPGKLTDEEWGLMRKHPEIGFNMLRQVRFLEGAAEIILAHHERWDGKGYPHGLHEDEIPLGARIFMVCDTFDSMTSDRPYRKALSTQQALNEILKYNGSQFDPKVVEAFLDIYETWVKEREEMMAEGVELRAA